MGSSGFTNFYKLWGTVRFELALVEAQFHAISHALVTAEPDAMHHASAKLQQLAVDLFQMIVPRAPSHAAYRGTSGTNGPYGNAVRQSGRSKGWWLNAVGVGALRWVGRRTTVQRREAYLSALGCSLQG